MCCGQLYSYGQAGSLKDGDDAGGILGWQARQFTGNYRGSNLADADRFSMSIFAITGDGLKCMTDGMAKVQDGAKTAFPFILGNNLGLDLAAACNDCCKCRGILL